VLCLDDEAERDGKGKGESDGESKDERPDKDGSNGEDKLFPCETLPRLRGRTKRPLRFSKWIATLVLKHATETREVMLVFTLEQKVGVGLSRALLSCMQQQNLRHAILLSGHGATSPTEKEIGALPAGWKVEVLPYTFFAFCLVRHCLIPRHRIVPRVEAERVTRHYGLTAEKMPGQTRANQLTRYYGLSPDDVVLYERNNGTQEVHSVLRMVK